MELLLDSGALTSAHKTNGFTPLHYAAAGGHVSIVQLLISRSLLKCHVISRSFFHVGSYLLHLMASIKAPCVCGAVSGQSMLVL